MAPNEKCKNVVRQLNLPLDPKYKSQAFSFVQLDNSRAVNQPSSAERRPKQKISCAFHEYGHMKKVSLLIMMMSQSKVRQKNKYDREEGKNGE